MKALRIYLLWLLLSIPGLLMLGGLLTGRTDFHGLLHPTGEFATRTLIVALAATPLVLAFPKNKITRWLLRNRRYFGVASFGYAALHTLFYLLDEPLTEVLAEMLEIGILTGWLAFLIYVPLAVTSNDRSVRALRGNWHRLQRWVHLAALLVFLHWCLVEYHVVPALVHFVPLLLLQLYRLRKERQPGVRKIRSASPDNALPVSSKSA